MLALPRASVIDARVARRANARRANARRKLSAARGGNAGPLSASRDARSTRARGVARASFSTASTPEAAMRGAMTRVRGDFVLARAESRGVRGAPGGSTHQSERSAQGKTQKETRVAVRVAALVFGAVVTSVAFAARASGTLAKVGAQVAAANEQVGSMVLTAGVLLVMSAFFSLAETSITTLYPWKVRELADQEGSTGGVFQIMSKDVTRFLTTILIGTTFSGIMATALITEAALILYGDGATTAVTVALTIVMLVFTEIAPKSVAVQHATVVARVIAKPIYLLSFVVYPLGRTCQIVVNAMFALFGLKTSAEPFVSEEELKLVLAGATKSGEVESAEKDMIQNVLDLEETVVRDVMTPLVQVHGVRSDATLAEFRTEWIEHKYSRVPAWEDRVDNIVGIVRANQIMQLGIERDLRPEQSKELEDVLVQDVMLRDTYFVPESMSVSKLLRELMQRKSHMCVVVNEFGGTVGIATLEDCVEEIVGEIYDEEDSQKANADEDEQDATPFIREVGQGAYLVDTRAALWKLADELSLDIPESPLYETVGGFVCDLFGSIPDVGASITTTFEHVEDEDASSDDESDGETDGLEFDGITQREVVVTVTDADTRRVNEIRVQIKRSGNSIPPEDSDDEESGWGDRKPKFASQAA